MKKTIKVGLVLMLFLFCNPVHSSGFLKSFWDMLTSRVEEMSDVENYIQQLEDATKLRDIINLRNKFMIQLENRPEDQGKINDKAALKNLELRIKLREEEVAEGRVTSENTKVEDFLPALAGHHLRRDYEPLDLRSPFSSQENLSKQKEFLKSIFKSDKDQIKIEERFQIEQRKFKLEPEIYFSESDEDEPKKMEKPQKEKRKKFVRYSFRPNKNRLLKTVDKFIETCVKNRQANMWLSGRSGLGKGMFAQKLFVENNGRVIFFGDPHGEAGAMRDLLWLLQDQGWISPKNPFKLIDKDGRKLYLMFLGDYIDRGDESAENLYIAMQLYIHNPQQVVVIRGNHEWIDITADREFPKELNLLYGFSDEITGNDNIEVHSDRAAVYRLFDYLVGSCFLIWKNEDGVRRSIFCAHNGIDPKHDYRKLLKAKNKYFELEPHREWTENRNVYCIVSAGGEAYEDWMLNREEYSNIFKVNCNLSDLQVIGMAVGHQQLGVSDVLIPGNGFYIQSGGKDEFQWKVDGPNELSVNRIMNEVPEQWQAKAPMPFAMIFDFFRYNTRVPDSRIAGLAYNNFHPGFMPVVSLDLDPDFSKCKFTRQFMYEEQMKKRKQR